VGAWVRRGKLARPARVTRFCLPFAGGGAAVFRQWPSGLPPSVEVCPIQDEVLSVIAEVLEASAGA